jgi:hypothetical protein
VPGAASRVSIPAAKWITWLIENRDSCKSSGFNLEVQQNIVALRPIRGEMFIESATSKKFFLAPAERNIVWSPRTKNGNIALRWSVSYRVRSTIYKHLAPLERKLIPLLHLKVEFILNEIK